MAGLVIRVLVNAAAILLAAVIVPGIQIGSAFTAVVGGVVLGLVNAIVRPLLLILTLPLTLLTLGLFIFVLNAMCFGLAAALVPGFRVDGCFPALLGAFLVSVASWAVNGFVLDRGRVVTMTHRR